MRSAIAPFVSPSRPGRLNGLCGPQPLQAAIANPIDNTSVANPSQNHLPTLISICGNRIPGGPGIRSSRSVSTCEEILLSLALAQAGCDLFEFRQAENDAARFGALVRANDFEVFELLHDCLLYTSDAADDLLCVD